MLNTDTRDKDKRSYNEAIKEYKNKKKNIILVKPKIQQNSEDTKKIIKEKVDIKNINMGVSKFKKGNKGTVILDCDGNKDFRILKKVVRKSWRLTLKLRRLYLGNQKLKS